MFIKVKTCLGLFCLIKVILFCSKNWINKIAQGPIFGQEKNYLVISPELKASFGCFGKLWCSGCSSFRLSAKQPVLSRWHHSSGRAGSLGRKISARLKKTGARQAGSRSIWLIWPIWNDYFSLYRFQKRVQNDRNVFAPFFGRGVSLTLYRSLNLPETKSLRR